MRIVHQAMKSVEDILTLYLNVVQTSVSQATTKLEKYSHNQLKG